MIEGVKQLIKAARSTQDEAQAESSTLSTASSEDDNKQSTQTIQDQPRAPVNRASERGTDVVESESSCSRDASRTLVPEATPITEQLLQKSESENWTLGLWAAILLCSGWV